MLVEGGSIAFLTPLVTGPQSSREQDFERRQRLSNALS
jgi:hypothetical protein